jgi:hypothetical protein
VHDLLGVDVDSSQVPRLYASSASASLPYRTQRVPAACLDLLDPTHDCAMTANAPRSEKHDRSPGDKFALAVGPSTTDGRASFTVSGSPRISPILRRDGCRQLPAQAEHDAVLSAACPRSRWRAAATVSAAATREPGVS